MIPGAEYVSQIEDLLPGDRLILYTDGLAEEPNQKLLDCIRENRRSTAKELLGAVLGVIDLKAVDDDLTLIVVAID